MNDCAVLICSCDKYEDAWSPFFLLLKKYWRDCPYPIYLNTETKIFEDMTGLGVKTLNSDPKMPWSKRLKNCLRQIDSRFVILLLEDFFLRSDVQQDVVSDCVEWMKREPIACVCFERYGILREEKKLYYDIFIQREKGARYTFNLQAGIWRKKTLLKCLNNFENPWEFEEIGNVRSNGIKEKFFVQVRGSEPVFDYSVNRDTGYGLYRGKWLKSNVELFSHEGISCDFSKMGFFEDESQFVVKKRSFQEKIAYYAKHPYEVFRITKKLLLKTYKKCYWGIEKVYYHTKKRLL